MSHVWILTDKINRREWWWPAVWSVVVVLITALPYLYGVWLSTPQNRFGGFVIGIEDGNTYLAKMQHGQAGYWLYHLVHTPEPHAGALFFLHYLVLGKVAGWLGWPLPLVLTLSRIFTIPFALFSFYVFAAYFSPHLPVRRWAVVLFGTTAGLGWLWVLLGLPAEPGTMPVDLWVPDASFFLSALTFPHLPLSVGLTLAVVVATLDFLETGRAKVGLLAAGAGLLVSLIHPYKLAVLGTIFGAYLLWQTARQRRDLKRAALRLALVILPSLPYLMYVLLMFETNWVFQTWRDQSLTLSPPPVLYALAFGLLLPLAAAGIWQARRLLRQLDFLWVWLLVVPVLLYVPISVQRRFLDGYQGLLALLGGAGLVWLLARSQRPGYRLLVSVLVLLPMWLTNLLLLTGALLAVGQQQQPVFYPGDQHLAMNWLADQTSGQVVLATRPVGNVLPGYAPVRVFVGHGPETVRAGEKQQLVAEFFSAGTDDTWRRNLLAAYAINYVYYGPDEAALGNFNPQTADYLQQVYQNHTVQIYQVTAVENKSQ